jgi:predicted glycosyltransferase
LPEFNTISFVRPFTKSVTDSELVDSDLIIRVYDELKKLIALEKAKKLGQGHRRKKTLRKKYKKPKKTKHIRRFTHNLKSKKHTKK